MSYTSEHRKMRPLLDQARIFDIASNPDPQALFEAGSAGLQVWCTPDDNPGGLWEKVAERMTAGAFSKPCAYVGGGFWQWEGEQIVGIRISTDAYLLRDHRLVTREEMRNRLEDLQWLRQKIEWLWNQTGSTLSLPPMVVEEVSRVGDKEL